MEKFRLGDRIRIIHEGKQEDICTILDILEDYDGSSYWLKSDKGTLLLEIETPETKIEKVDVPETTKERTSQIHAQA